MSSFVSHTETSESDGINSNSIDSHYVAPQIEAPTELAIRFAESNDDEEETESTFDGEAIEARRMPSSIYRALYNCRLPKNRKQFVLGLPADELNKVLAPVRDGILGTETVFSIKDKRSGICLALAAQDMMEIFEKHGQKTQQSSTQFEDLSEVLEMQKKKRKFFQVAAAVGVFLLAVFIVAVVLGTQWKKIFGPGDTSDSPTPRPTLSPNSSAFLIAGGIGSEADFKLLRRLDSVELYYPNQTSLNKLLDLKLGTPRFGMAAGVLNGIAILAGGSNLTTNDIIGIMNPWEVLNDVELIDLKLLSILKGPSLNVGRVHAGAAIFETKFWVCGGYSNYYEIVSSCETIDENFKGWETAAEMFISRNMFPMLEAKNMLYAIFGDKDDGISIESCSSSSGWEMNGGDNGPGLYMRYGMSAAETDGNIVICGGGLAVNDLSLILDQCQTLSQNMWISALPMTRPRALFSMVRWSDGSVWSFGGFENLARGLLFAPQNTSEYYEFGFWKSAPGMIQNRAAMAVVPV